MKLQYMIPYIKAPRSSFLKIHVEIGFTDVQYIFGVCR